MTQFLSILALGFFLGMRHATDADHVVAVTTIVARHRTARSAALIGAAWGLGHTLTILVVGGAIILLGWVIPPRVGMSMEMTVGAMLCVLGLVNLRGVIAFFRSKDTKRHPHDARVVHAHAHPHGDYVHTHVHGHDPEAHPHDPQRTPVGWLDRHFGGIRLYQLVRPLLIGVVHGLAGSAAVALLILAAIQRSGWAVVYLLVFGLGTIAGMMLITAAIGVPFAITGRRSMRMQHGLRLASGAVSLAVGIFVAYRAGVDGGLFRRGVPPHPAAAPLSVDSTVQR